MQGRHLVKGNLDDIGRAITMPVTKKLRYPLLLPQCLFWILDFGLWIGGFASLYLLLKQAEYPKSKIRNPNSKIYI